MDYADLGFLGSLYANTANSRQARTMKIFINIPTKNQTNLNKKKNNKVKYSGFLRQTFNSRSRIACYLRNLSCNYA